MKTIFYEKKIYMYRQNYLVKNAKVFINLHTLNYCKKIYSCLILITIINLSNPNPNATRTPLKIKYMY